MEKMPEVIDWRDRTGPEGATVSAAEALRAGRLVAFPTDTLYSLAASASSPEAVERLCRLARHEVGQPLPLAVGTPNDALAWAPGLGWLGRRFLRRCWPGPVVFRLSEGVAWGSTATL